jgi:transposase
MANHQVRDNNTSADSALDSILSRDLQSHLPGDVRQILEVALAAQRAVFDQEKAELTDRIATEVTAEVTAAVTAQVTARLTAEFHAKVQVIYEQIVLARRRMFGPSSEALGQARLFNEAELAATETPAGAGSAGEGETGDQAGFAPATSTDVDASVPGKKPAPRARGKRAALAIDLPRVDVIHELSEAERTAPDGTLMVVIGQEVSEQLDIVPMQIRVLRHIRKRYAHPGGVAAPRIAPVAAQVLPKSNASASTLAMLIICKYFDGLPLARLEYVMARAGVRLTRSTMARWMIAVARALQPIHNLMRDSLLSGPLIHMDETTVQVLKEPGRAAQSKSYMWVQLGGEQDRPVVLFDYEPSRSGGVALKLLEGWSGYLMSDGYGGYDRAVDSASAAIVHLKCWAHARRYFMDAKKVHLPGKHGLADEALAMIGKLYRIERDIAKLPDRERLAVRKDKSAKILKDLRAWLTATLARVAPGSLLGKALVYMDNQWAGLVRYIDRADLPIDNNKCENAIRPFVVGRKGWLFSDTQAGAHASAVLYSLIQTATLNGLEPYTWIRSVLERLPLAKSVDDYDALLPWNMHPLSVPPTTN